MRLTLLLVAALAASCAAAPATTYWWHFSHMDCPYEDVACTPAGAGSTAAAAAAAAAADGPAPCADKSVAALEAACVASSGCVAFNTDGYLKGSKCTPSTMTSSTCDLYFMEDTPQPSPTPQPPSVWPAPASMATGSDTVTLDPASFKFVASTPFDDLTAAIARYTALVFPHSRSTALRHAPAAASTPALPSLTITVADPTAALQLGVNESYTLTVPSSGDGAALAAHTFYGALRGLETFSQLVVYDFDAKLYHLPVAPVAVTDAPRFPHRGILLDTARHFEPVPSVTRLLDAMSYSKFNTLHWHIVDQQSFPFESVSNPKLWDGAWSSLERYTTDDVAYVVEYARQRGIRVMPEFDTPGHAAAWCTGYPDICPSATCQMPLNVASNATYDVIHGVFKDAAALFPEKFLHLGGDEVNTDCWTNTPSIAAWLKDRGFNASQGYAYFLAQTQDLAHSVGRTPVAWEEVWNLLGDKLDPTSIIEVWLSKKTLAAVVNAGYRGILSDNDLWYLDHLSTTWEQMYANEPLAGLTNATAWPNVLGGEACQWGETVDTSDLEQTVWPRAAAVAERLWSPRDVNSTDAAHPRLAWFRCLLNRRGIAAAPLNNANARTSPPNPGACLLQ